MTNMYNETRSYMPQGWPVNYQKKNSGGIHLPSSESLAQEGKRPFSLGHNPVANQQMPLMMQMDTQVNAQKIANAYLRVEEDRCKKVNSEIIKGKAEEEKIIRCELERERKKTQVESIAINNEGIPVVYTENVVCGKIDRVFSNISNPSITIVTCVEDDTKMGYIFQAKIGEKNVWSFLNPDECGRGAYVMRALTRMGVTILGKKTSDKKGYAVQLLALLIANPVKQVSVPKKRGWYQDDKVLKFFKSEYTWRKLQKCLVR